MPNSARPEAGQSHAVSSEAKPGYSVKGGASLDVTLATLVAIVTLTFFIITLRPDVGGTEDSPKFQFVGRVLGTSHSPGYPFYAMATWAFGWLPVGNLAWRINLFSAVCGALSCVVVFLTARRLGVTRLLSVAAAFGAATGYPVWSNSVTAEVYTLAAVLSGGAIYFLIAFGQTGAYWRLYLACALWACGFGNHVTISGILPAAVIYGIVKDRGVLTPRVAIAAALIGIAGVLQYWFIAIRTMQGAPYLEARADTIKGVFDVIIARDVSWARFYQAQSTVAAIEVPMLLNGLRVHMGLIPFVLAAIAIAIGIKRRNAEVLLIFGAAAGTLGFIANLWGDVVGFITPVCVQLWPLAALGLQWSIEAGHQAIRPSGHQAIRPSGHQLTMAAGALAFIVPVTNVATLWPSINALRQPGEGPGVRALYSHLPMRSAIVAENYWLARLINYMHFSEEVQPDPNPRVLNSDSNDVRAALNDGLQVYAFEGATHWLRAQGYRFDPTPIARVPFEQWIPQQPPGTLLAIAAAGRALPFEWLPVASGAQYGRPANYGAIVWTLGDPNVTVEQRDNLVRLEREVGDRALIVSSSDDGPQMVWGDDVLEAIDRGLIVAAFKPNGGLIGHWSFALDDALGVQLPPIPYLLRGESTCAVLRPNQAADVTTILADGAWWATVDGSGRALISLDAGSTSGWRNLLAQGRGDASIEGAQLILQPTPGTRAIFRFSMPPLQAPAVATLASGDVQAVRVCQSDIPTLPASGAFEVMADRDAWFGSGWHLAERAGLQRFRWSERQSTLQWRVEKVARIRFVFRMRAANKDGTTVLVSANGGTQSACALPASAWTECRVQIPETAVRAGINQLTMTANTVSPPADRPGDPRELSFVMQAGRVRMGQ